jgi:hypothetical protein
LCLSLFQTVPHCMLNNVLSIHRKAALDWDVVYQQKKTTKIFLQNPSSISSQVP